MKASKCHYCSGKGCEQCRDTGWLPYWCTACGRLLNHEGECLDCEDEVSDDSDLRS